MPQRHEGDAGILGVVPDPWSSIWMPRQHVMTRLAQHFPVVWVDPPREWREWWGLEPNPRARALMLDDARSIPAGFQVYRPGRWRPQVFRPLWLARWTERARLKQAVRMLRRQGARRTVLYLWQDELAPALDAIEHDVSCYHIDDEYTFSTTDLPVSPVEAALIKRVDQVFIHSPALLEKKGNLNPHTTFIPNGVDYSTYATPQPEPADLAGVPHPRVGYVGVIKEHLDLPKMLVTARAHPEWSWVVVGPTRLSGADQETFNALRALPQVHYLGAKPVQSLPGYMQGLDVGLLPYRLTGYTKFIYPMKLHEYLATGIPVVGTPIRSLEEYNGTIALVAPEADWGAAIATRLRDGGRTGAAAAARQAAARAHDWDRLVEEIAARIRQRLAERRGGQESTRR